MNTYDLTEKLTSIIVQLCKMKTELKKLDYNSKLSHEVNTLITRAHALFDDIDEEDINILEMISDDVISDVLLLSMGQNPKISPSDFFVGNTLFVFSSFENCKSRLRYSLYLYLKSMFENCSDWKIINNTKSANISLIFNNNNYIVTININQDTGYIVYYIDSS